MANDEVKTDDAIRFSKDKDGSLYLKAYTKDENDSILAVSTTHFSLKGDLIYGKQTKTADGKLADSESLAMNANGKITYILFRIAGDHFETVEYGHTDDPKKLHMRYHYNDENYNEVKTYDVDFNAKGKLEKIYEIATEDGKRKDIIQHDPKLIEQVKQLRVMAVHKATEIKEQQTIFWHNSINLFQPDVAKEHAAIDLPMVKATEHGVAV